LVGILAAFPIVVALSRASFLALGLGEQAAWTVSIAVGAAIVGAITFYLSQREQRLLIEKEAVSKQRADAEMRYRLLADNAVDIIIHLRGTEVAWISPSVEAALGQPRASGTYVGVLFCAVDQFKNINDTWGHGIGDLVLVTLAARICESVRAGDTVGRTGGDEILVLLPGINGVDEVAQIAEAIRWHAAEPIQLSENAIYATLSIGATIALPGEHVSTITARADAAMYQAKSGTRNPVIQISA
jgi:diguanylate cyclase (GGDEF)-like protein